MKWKKIKANYLIFELKGKIKIIFFHFISNKTLQRIKDMLFWWKLAMWKWKDNYKRQTINWTINWY